MFGGKTDLYAHGQKGATREDVYEKNQGEVELHAKGKARDRGNKPTSIRRTRSDILRLGNKRESRDWYIDREGSPRITEEILTPRAQLAGVKAVPSSEPKAQQR